MMKRYILVYTLLSVLCLYSRAQIKTPAGNRKAIICLTYDDALETQLTTALPQLDSVGLKATFFLPSIQGSSLSEIIGHTPEAVLGWTNAAKNGHELANHTLFHPCPDSIGWDKSVSIDNYTMDRMITEVKTQNTILSLLDPARKRRAFAYPCVPALIEGENYAKVLKKQGLITYIRQGGDSNSVITDLRRLDPDNVPSWLVWTGTTLQQLISFAERTKKANGMGIYMFHGVDKNIFMITSETHRSFLKYLKDHQDEFWITTFSDAMNFVSDNYKTR